MKSDKTLSILIDESGDFGKFDFKDPNYHVVMVIHEQQDDITDRVKEFNRTLNDRGYSNHYIHVGPLTRRERPYPGFFVLYLWDGIMALEEDQFILIGDPLPDVA